MRKIIDYIIGIVIIVLMCLLLFKIDKIFYNWNNDSDDEYIILLQNYIIEMENFNNDCIDYIVSSGLSFEDVIVEMDSFYNYNKAKDRVIEFEEKYDIIR